MYNFLKHLIIILLLLLTIDAVSQVDKKNEFRLSYLAGFSVFEPSLSRAVINATPTRLINGGDIKFILPSRNNNFNWLLGSMFVVGRDGYSPSSSNVETATTYGGGIYFGPEINTKKSLIQFSSYISVGIFSFHDDILETRDTEITHYTSSNFTAPGVKSGLSIKLNVKILSLNLGYHAFATASQNSSILRHGPEIGIGINL